MIDTIDTMQVYRLLPCIPTNLLTINSPYLDLVSFTLSPRINMSAPNGDIDFTGFIYISLFIGDQCVTWIPTSLFHTACIPYLLSINIIISARANITLIE